MNVHKNAKLTPRGREQIIRRYLAGETPRSLSSAVGVSPASVYKWLRRFKEAGIAGLADRSSRPRRLRLKVTDGQQQMVQTLRRQRLAMWKIAARTGLSRATVARICKRLGLSRLKNLDERPPAVRYEKDAPGDMIHIDIKKLGRIHGVGHRITGDRTGQSNKRGTGWEYLHLAVDDHSRLAYSEVLPDETRKSCIRFLINALRFFRAHGVRVCRVMTDNGVSFRSRRYRNALRLLKIKHIRTRPYTPQTNGKAERFVQTSLREWAYAKTYTSSEQRTAELLPFLRHYNYHRPHFGIKGNSPISRVPVNNLSRHDT